MSVKLLRVKDVRQTICEVLVHCGWLEIGGRKMSKSKERLYTVPELLEMGYTGKDLRMLMLKQHYRAPLPFDLELLDEAKKLRVKLNNFVAFEMPRRPEGPSQPAVEKTINECREKFKAALEDDLNTSVAFAIMYELMTTINRLEPSADDAKLVLEFMAELDNVFGIIDFEEQVVDLDAEIEGLIAERNQARADKNFQRSDEIRDLLLSKGIVLVDTQGTEWRKSAD